MSNFTDQAYLDQLVKQLSEKGVTFEPGLTDDEITNIEAENNFKFPPDLRAFLHHSLPIGWLREYDDGKKIVSWRQDAKKVIRHRQEHLIYGLIFDVKNNRLWLPEWGEKPKDIENTRFWIPEWEAKPSDLSQVRGLVENTLAKAPFMIPIYSHRYLPAEPLLEGNPVFSIVQTDIIHYGNDLADYFAHEFHFEPPEWAAKTPRPIRFWDHFI